MSSSQTPYCFTVHLRYVHFLIYTLDKDVINFQIALASVVFAASKLGSNLEKQVSLIPFSSTVIAKYASLLLQLSHERFVR